MEMPVAPVEKSVDEPVETGANRGNGGRREDLLSPFRVVAWRVVKYHKGMKLLERITLEPGKCGGQPCIRGKRMRVTDILDLLSHGASPQEILADYSFLEREDILAAIAYASRLTDHVVLTSA